MFDIDTPADLLELKRCLGSMDGAIAPRTRRYLDTLNLLERSGPSTVAGEDYSTAEEFGTLS